MSLIPRERREWVALLIGYAAITVVLAWDFPEQPIQKILLSAGGFVILFWYLAAVIAYAEDYIRNRGEGA